MKRLKTIAFSLLMGLVSLGFQTEANAQVTQISQESFETNGNGSRYTTSPAEFATGANGCNDFFTRKQDEGDGANNATCPSALYNDPAGEDGTFFFAAEDDENGPPTLTLNASTVTGFSSIAVKVLLATPRTARFEVTDFITIQYNMDGGGWNTIGAFYGQAPGPNADMQQDTDLNGSGDGGFLTQNFQDFTFAVPATGNSLQVRINLGQNGGGEEIAFDNIRIEGIATANDPPVLANIESTAIIYNENDAATLITSAITASDPDDTQFTGGSVSIVNNHRDCEDQLTFTNQNGITGSYNSSSGVLTLSGTASIANYQTALRSVRYQNTNATHPDTVSRTIRFSVSDGTNNSNPQDRIVRITRALSAAAPLNYTEDFETDGLGTRYDANFFDDNGTPNDFFDRIQDGTGYLATSGDPTGESGSSYIAAKDFDDLTGNPATNCENGNIRADLDAVLRLRDINVAGFTNFQVSVLLGGNGLQFETTDFIRIEAAFDGNIASETYTTVGAFYGSGTSTALTQDADLNGAADPAGATLSTALTDFTFSIPGSGSLLSVRIVLGSNGGAISNTEEFYYDNIRVTGAPACTPPTFASNPVDATVCLGLPANFSATTSGTTPDSLRWHCSVDGGLTWQAVADTGSLSGTSTNILGIAPTLAGFDNNQYRLVAYSCAGAEVDSSSPGTLNLIGITPTTQVSIDGGSNESVWKVMANRLNPNPGFNNGTILSDILYHSTCDTLYLSVRSLASQASTDGIGLWLDLSGVAGTAPNTNLGLNDGTAHYIGNTNSPNFQADFEVDYMFAWNSGVSANNMFLDAGRPGIGAQFMGNVGQGGTPILNIGIGIFDAGTIRMAYDADTCFPAMEFAIPWSQIGGVSTNVRAFAFEVSATGFFSNQTIPGNAASAPGANPAFGSIGGGPYHSGFVLVGDTTSPVAVCQDITVHLDGAGSASAAATDIDNGSSDNCAIDTLTLSQTAFVCGDVGANSVTLTVTDIAGNTGTCTAVVTVLDTTSPTAICQDITVILDGAGNANITAGDVDNGSSDNCGLGTLSISQSSFTCANVGANSVTLTVPDLNGNSSTCTSVVTVSDTTAPVAVCQDLTLVLDGSGNGSITAGDINNGSSDNCGIASSSVSPAVFNCSNVGANSATLTVSDASGNSATCSSVITVLDTTSPTAICQDVTVFLDGSGNAVIAPGNVDNGSADACGISSQSLSVSSFTCSNVGANSTTLTVTDNNSNTNSCSAVITVTDSTAPTAICQDITLQFSGGGTITIAATDIDNGSSDNCGIATYAASDTSFTCADVGNNPVTLTVTDVNGNSSTCVSNVTVSDTVAPTAVCQDITVQLNASGNGSITASDLDNGSSDACGIASYSASDSTFACADVGANSVTLTVTDGTGNTATCTSIVTVSDTVPPTAICQDVTVFLDGSGNAVIAPGNVDNGSADACGISSQTLSVSSFTCSNVGANSTTLTVTDNNSNTNSCSALVTVTDSTAPTAICQDITLQFSGGGTITIAATDIDNGSSDNCGIATYAASDTSFTCADVGNNPVTLTVTDVNGNSSTCVSNVTVSDTVAPTAVCQDITVQLNASGNGTITASDLDNGSSDACGIASYSASDSTFACADVGANSVTLTVTDGTGNTATCTSIVTVSDAIVPSAICQDITVQLNGAGTATIVATDVDGGSSDACGIATYSVSDTSFTCADVGANSVLLTVTDVNGNSGSCTSFVTVSDTVPPTAICQDITVQLNGSGNASITASDLDNGSSDACGSVGYSSSDTSFTCADVGSNAVTLTVTDVNGNSSTCVSNVTVSDTVPPTAVCQDITVQLNGSGTATISGTDLDNGSSDACGIATYTASDTSFTCADVGANSVTLTVTDVNGNSSTCTSVVTVSDTVPPTAVCQDITVQLNGSGNANIVATDVDGGSTDACGISNYAISDTSFTCADVGSNAVTLMVTDVNGNSSTCVSNVTVSDTVPSTAVCQDITVQLNGAGNANIVATDLDGGSSDACGIATYASSDTSFTCVDVGSNSVTLTVTDVNGNSSTCVSNVTVSDTVPPTAICQDITVQLDGSGNAVIGGTDLDNGSSDACGIATYTASDTSFTCADVGANSVTLTVTDVNGNSNTCTSVVTVSDTVPPTAVCQDITIQLNGSGNANIVATDVDGGSTDACGISTYAISDTSFTCADVGFNSVTLTVTDVNGNSSTCVSNVTVSDTVPPTAVCQDITVQLNGAGNASIVATDLDGGSSDACGIGTYASSDTSFTCADVGSNSVTLTVTDVNGNSSTCVSNVTISDTVPPTAVCQDITVQLNGSGNANIVATDVDGGSTDACGISTYAVSDTSFTCADVGSNSVTLTVTDVNGNSSTCVSNVTVSDTVPPTAVCQDITVQLNGAGNANIVATDLDGGSSDACGIAAYASSDTSFTCADVGSNALTLTVADVNGNSSTCVSNVTVSDTVPPTAICQDITVQLDGTGNAVIAGIDLDNGSSDACGISTYVASDTSFTCADVGANSVTLTVTDVNGNSSTCTSVVTVSDTVPPTAVCQDITVQLDGSGNANIVATDVDGGSTDACGISTYAVSDTSFTCADVGSNSVTLTVTDVNGNSSTCVSNVTVSDTVPPTAVCQDITVQLNGAGNANIVATDLDGGSSDACGIATYASSDTSFTCADVGSNSVTLTVTDVNGNSSTCVSNVTVSDTVPPTAICQDITVQLDGSGNAVIAGTDLDNGSSDACGISTYTASDTSFTCADVGANSVTLTVTDVNGNSSTCTSVVTVSDTVPPTAVCQDITVQLDGSGNANIVATDVDGGSTDACGISNYAISDTSFTCADVGSNSVTLTVTDVNGNSSTCVSNVTVSDTVPPTAVCQDITVQLNGAGNASIIATDLDGGSSDACGIGTYASSDTSFTCADVGSNAVTLTVTDVNGNSSTCVSNVTVSDTVPPTAICQDITVQLDGTGNAVIAGTDLDNGSSDACGISTYVASDTSFTCAEVGANSVTLTVTDVNGNSSTCTSLVTVSDTVPPTAVCQDITVQLDSAGTATIVATDVDGGSSDACGISTYAVSDTSFNCADLGSNSVTFTVTDVNGNSSTCVSNVTVSDTIAPTAVCQDISLFLDVIGTASLTANDLDGGSTDNCSVDSLIVSQSSFNCSDIGTNSITLTVIDPSANQSTCISVVTVIDSTAPTAICQDISVFLDASGNASILAGDIDGGSSDNCSIDTLVTSQSSFNCSDAGANSVTLTVTDPSGNSSTCTSVVTVVDTIAPIITACPSDTTIIAQANNCAPGVSWTPPSASDNCQASLSSNFTPGDTFFVGTTQVIYVATDSAGNVDSCSFNITVVPQPLVLTLSSPTSACGTNISCAGDSSGAAMVSVSGGCMPYSYLWSTGDTTDSISGLGAGSYTVTVTDSLGTTSTDTIILTEPNPLSLSFSGQLMVCVGDSNGSIDLSVSGGATCAAYTYNWSNGASTEDLSGLPAGTYLVTVTDTNGCSITDSVTIGNFASPTVNIGNDTLICADASIMLDGTTGGVVAYQWSTGDTTAMITIDSAGSYSVMITDTNGCMASDTLTVTEQPLPVVNLGNDTTICDASPLLLDAGSWSSVLWSTGDTTQTLTVLSSDTVWVMVSDSIGCMGTDTIIVDLHTVAPSGIMSVGPAVLCIDDTLELRADPGFVSYLWSDGSMNNRTFVSTGGWYTVTVGDSTGCLRTDSLFVDTLPFADPNPMLTPGGTQYLCGSNDSLVLDGGFHGGGYLWSNGDTNQTTTVTQPGSYYLLAYNGLGCSEYSDTVTVLADSVPTPVISETVNSAGDTILTTTPNSGYSYQWYYQFPDGSDSLLVGETGADYQPTSSGCYFVIMTSVGGCEAMSNVLCITIVGVDVQQLSGIEVYPNPSTGLLRLRALSPIDHPLTIKVVDMYGQIVKDYRMNHLVSERQLDLSELAKGMYLIGIEAENGKKALFRVVIE